MNIKSIIDGRLSDSLEGLSSVLSAFGVVYDSRLGFESDAEFGIYLSDACNNHGLSGFVLSDGYVFNRDDAEWRRLLTEMDKGWVSFYGAKKLGPDQYTVDKSRLFVGTRNPDFIPVDKRAKGVMESGTTWDMDGSEHKWDYVRFFDRVKGEWRSTYKAYTVQVGNIPQDQQIPYDEWKSKFGGTEDGSTLLNTKYKL